MAPTIDALVLLDEIEGFAGVETATDAFFGWWSEFIVPAEEIGYLGFGRSSKTRALLPEYVETIGGAGACRNAADARVLRYAGAFHANE